MKILATLALIFVSACATHYKNDKHAKHSSGSHSEHKHHKMWEKMDTDKDGFISKKEFEDKKMKKFETMDGNKDGKLSHDEVKAHHHGKMAKKKGCCGN